MIRDEKQNWFAGWFEMPHDNARMGEEGKEGKKQKIAPDETTNDCGVCLASFCWRGNRSSAH